MGRGGLIIKNSMTMKRFYYIAIVLCSMFAVSCENIEPNDGLDTSIEENEILIYAAGADATRAYVSEVGASTGDPSTIVWDEIMLRQNPKED